MSLIVHLSHLPTSCGTQLVLELPTLHASPLHSLSEKASPVTRPGRAPGSPARMVSQARTGGEAGILAVTWCLLKLVRKRQFPGFLSLPGLGFATPFVGHPTDRGNFYPYLGGHTKNLTIKTGLS